MTALFIIPGMQVLSKAAVTALMAVQAAAVPAAVIGPTLMVITVTDLTHIRPRMNRDPQTPEVSQESCFALFLK